ncbi:MAG TPA: hypothetical protein VMT85_00180 [Thermoanaerobaculia bacterium]|nr:hypothetical protein [Thermoanaerobaculia bacterium]
MKFIAGVLASILGATGSASQPTPEAIGQPQTERSVRAYVTNFGGDGISVIDPSAHRLVAEVATGDKPHGVAIAPDGTAVYVSNEGSGTLSVIDPRSNEVLSNIDVGDRPNQIATSADGRHVFVTLNGADAVSVVDVEDRKVARVVPIGRRPHIAQRSPDGNIIYITCEGDMKLVALDAESWDVLHEIPLFGWPRVLAVTGDGAMAYQTMRWLNGVLIIDLRQRAVVDRIAFDASVFAPEGKDAHGPALTPDGRELWLTRQTSNDVAVFGRAIESSSSVFPWVAIPTGSSSHLMAGSRSSATRARTTSA